MTDRRNFIKQGIVVSAGFAFAAKGFNAKSYASIVGSNERVNIAVIGIRSKGASHIDALCSLKDIKNVNIRTICDVDKQFFDERSKIIYNKTGKRPLIEMDMRKVFDDKDIDAVTFATPNHWHALGTIWACQAGKHVYVEKPISHNIFEGRKMIEAARKYNVRVQSGTQNRSHNDVIEAIKFLHEGGIGDVYLARGLCIKPRDSFGIAEDSKPPLSLNYDMWLGPATWRPYNEKKGHYNWHWFWDTGNGDTGNQGPHQFDIARWGLNKNEHPVSIYSTGGIYGIDPSECAQETPNTQKSVFKYKDGKILEFETRGRYSNGEGSLNLKVGNIFYGTEGYLEVGNGGPWRAFRKRESKPFAGSNLGEEREIDQSVSLTSMPSPHHANFIDAIRSGRSEDLNCDILEGHYSSVLPHLAGISYRLKRELKFVGEYEMFVNDSEADSFLTRKYRKPYVLPTKI